MMGKRVSVVLVLVGILFVCCHSIRLKTDDEDSLDAKRSLLVKQSSEREPLLVENTKGRKKKGRSIADCSDDDDDDGNGCHPTNYPTKYTKYPTNYPTKYTKYPTNYPTKYTKYPTTRPTPYPTKYTKYPTTRPTKAPYTKFPTIRPTKSPYTKYPTRQPSTIKPTLVPTRQPTKQPTVLPTKKPTPVPTRQPTKQPTVLPTKKPTPVPTRQPTKQPTTLPTKKPTPVPTRQPTKQPTLLPTKKPTPVPTRQPTKQPTVLPTKKPTPIPTRQPTTQPTPSPFDPNPPPPPTNLPTPSPFNPNPPGPPTPAPTQCTAVIDLMIIIDASNSIGKYQWQKEKNFAKDVAGGFEFSSTATRGAIISFSTTIQSSTTFTNPIATNLGDFQDYIDGITRHRHSTNIALALKTATETFQTSASPPRPNAVRSTILVTDGKPTTKANAGCLSSMTNKACARARAEDLVDPTIGNSQLLYVAVGNAAEDLFQGIIPNNQVYDIADFEALQGIVQAIIAQACNA